MYFDGLFAEMSPHQGDALQNPVAESTIHETRNGPKSVSPTQRNNAQSDFTTREGHGFSLQEETATEGLLAHGSRTRWNDEDNGYVCEDDYEDDEDADDPENDSASKRRSVTSANGIPESAGASPSIPTKDPQSIGQGTERPGGKRRKQELHRRHSKRYRDNLGELFHELELILPQVMPDCRLKTKSQIIATSVNAVKRLKTEVSTLEMRFVMSSGANRAKWVEETVENAPVIQDAIEPFMRLILGLQRWKHSELWMRTADNGVDYPNRMKVRAMCPFCLRLERVTSATYTSNSPSNAQHFKEFIEGSEVMTFEAGDDSLVGRIATSLSPEWIDLNDKASLTGFKRGHLALRCGLVVCFAVPVLVRGHVTAVVLFYDNQPRSDIPQGIKVAQDLASAIGNCYGAMMDTLPPQNRGQNS